MNRALDRTAFRALGTVCSVSVSTTALELASARRAALAVRTEVEACERVLSRFDPGSDLSRANAAAGFWVDVDERLVEALSEALRFRRATGGRCDPTVLPALLAAGYDRSFERLEDHGPAVPVATPGDVELDARRVRVPPGGAIDLGATAKGLIARRALRMAFRVWPRLPGALVDLGGDVAVAGHPPDGDAWHIEVEDPRRPGGVLGVVRLTTGAAATSGPLRRRFGPGHTLHHLIDPQTLAPAAGPLAVTVVAGDPVAADAHATALAVTPAAEAAGYVAERPGLGAVVVPHAAPPLVLGAIELTAAVAA